MMSDDELRAELNSLADQVEVTTVTLDQVQARGRRRALYQRGAVVMAAFALVVGGTVAVTSLTGDGSGDTDLATDLPDDAGEAGDGDGADGAEGLDDADRTDAATESAATDEAGAVTTTTLPENFVYDSDMQTVTRFEGEGPPQVVPWGDGFLSIGSRWIESPPDDTVLASAFGSTEIAEFFSDEVIAVIESAGEVSLDSSEVEVALEEAGVIEEAAAVVEANPEVLNWFLDRSPGGRSESFAEYSDDGTTWEPVPGFAWPGDGWTPQFASNGQQLVAVSYGSQFEVEPAGATTPAPQMSVFITDDLVTWVEAPLTLERPDVPDYASGDFSPNQLALGDDGWYLSVSFWGWIDVWAALPADVQAEVDANGYSWHPTPAGIQIQDWTSTEPLPVPTTTVLADGATTDDLAFDEAFDGDWEPTVIRTVPWSELPFTYDDYQSLNGSETASTQAFVGDFEGNISPATYPGEADTNGQVVATDAGFFMIVTDYGDSGFAEESLAQVAEPTLRGFTSADGRQWTEVGLALPDVAWVDSLARVEGGILVSVSGSSDGQRFYVGAPNGTGFTPVDGPDIGNVWAWFGSQSATEGVAAVVDLGASSTPDFVTWTASFTHDGYDIELVADDQGDQTLTVRLDGEIVVEQVGGAFGPPPYEWIDDGIRISDADGETVVEIPLDVVDAEIFRVESEAWNAIWEANPYVADYRLIASRDGRTWIMEELPTTTADIGWFGTPALNGDTVVVFDDRGNPFTVALP